MAECTWVEGRPGVFGGELFGLWGVEGVEGDGEWGSWMRGARRERVCVVVFGRPAATGWRGI